jgi:uncharacterized delta-60 repeat protein
MCRETISHRPSGPAPSVIRTTALAIALLALFASGASAYVPADLDRLFGGNGVIVDKANERDLATRHNLLGLSDGSVLAVHVRTGAPPSCGYGIAIERFAGNTGAPLGSLELPADSSCSAPIPQVVAIDADESGHLFVATAEGSSLRLTRLGEDGTVDPSFGAAGSVVFATPQPVLPSLLRAWSDSEVLIAGRALLSPGPSSDTFVARVRSDGNLDPSFRNGGISFFDVGIGESAPEPSALEVEQGGTFYLAGPLERNPAEMERRPIAVRAFRANGEVDPGFGRNGVAKLDGAAAPSMDLDRGRLLIAASGGGQQPRVIGLKRNGRLDRGFGDDGVVTIQAPHGFSLAEVEADPGGRVVVAGSTGCCGPQRQKKLAVRRFEPDGHIDRTFADGGFFYLPAPHATPHQEVPVEGLFVSSGNAGGGIAVSGSIGRPPQLAVRFRLEGQASHERCQGRGATIVGSSRGEKLVGTQGTDVIVGLGGPDHIFGRGGNDVICGGKGRDVLRGGRGRNQVFPQS